MGNLGMMTDDDTRLSIMPFSLLSSWRAIDPGYAGHS